MYPIECVARGYLTGSALLDYHSNGEVCGIALPKGLVDGSRLPSAIFTPATKAALGDHDENVSFESVVGDIGPGAAAELRDLTLAVYARAEAIARERGIILADTKLEFGSRLGPSVDLRVRARPCWPTRCSPRTRAGTGLPPSGSPVGRRTPTTSRSCATGWSRRRAVGTGPRGPLRHRCPPTSSTAHVRATSRLSRCSRANGFEAGPAAGADDSRCAGGLRRPRGCRVRLSRRSPEPPGVASVVEERGVDEGEPRVGMHWRDHTVARIVPEMEITAMTPASCGRDRRMAWHLGHLDADLRTGSHGCVVDVIFGFADAACWLRSAGWPPALECSRC